MMSAVRPSSLAPVPHVTVELPAVIRSADDLGKIVRAQRREMGLRQMDLAGIGNTGNRLIVDLESGKPTVQLQKALNILALLGLEVVIRPKTPGVL